MSQDQGSAGATGCVIAAVVVVVLVVCGGGALVVAGALLFYRAERAVPAALPPPAAVAHASVLEIDASGSLVWDGTPVEKGELTRRLDDLKALPGPPRSVILRIHPAAPPATGDEARQLLGDRGIGYIVEVSP